MYVEYWCVKSWRCNRRGNAAVTAGISVAPPRAAAARDVRHRGASARAGRWSLDSSERYRAVFLFGQIIYAKFDAVFRN